MNSVSYRTPVRSMSRRRASGVSSRSRPASTAADTARTRNSAPSRSGASSIAACASASAAARSPRRTAMSARSAEIVTTVSAAPRCARPREDLVRAPQGRVKTVRDREGGQGQDRPVLAAVGLDREARRDRALREVDRGGRRAQVQHLFHGERGERGGLQHVACRAARVSQGGDRRLGLAPGRRRGGAEAQQRDLELLACRLPGREPLLGAAQDRRSFGGAAGEEEHAAELDCRRGDRGRVLAALDDLRQRGDRLRCAGAGVRLAELEHDRGAVAVGGRLVEGAGEQGGRAGCVAQAPARRGRRPAAAPPPRGRRPARCA